MPVCFICLGILLIMFAFNVFSPKFFVNSTNKLVVFLFICIQIFSFFLKDIQFNGISIVYYICPIFMVVLLLLNLKRINIIPVLACSFLIATGLIALGFIDINFQAIFQNRIFLIAPIIAIIPIIFIRDNISSILCILLGFIIFAFALTVKQNTAIDLSNVVILNLFSLSFLINIIVNSIVFIIKGRIKYEKSSV